MAKQDYPVDGLPRTSCRKILNLPLEIEKTKLDKNFPSSEYRQPFLHMEIGNLKFDKLCNKSTGNMVSRYELKEKLPEGTAVKLLMLKQRKADAVFHFISIYKDAALLPNHQYIACLEDIMAVSIGIGKKGLELHSVDARLLAKDILSGICALRDVGMKRHRFNKKDIFLVQLDDNHAPNFKIGRPLAHFLSEGELFMNLPAGVEKCTQFTGHWKDMDLAEEAESLRDILGAITCDYIDLNAFKGKETDPDEMCRGRLRFCFGAVSRFGTSMSHNPGDSHVRLGAADAVVNADFEFV